MVQARALTSFVRLTILRREIHQNVLAEIIQTNGEIFFLVYSLGECMTHFYKGL